MHALKQPRKEIDVEIIDRHKTIIIGYITSTGHLQQLLDFLIDEHFGHKILRYKLDK